MSTMGQPRPVGLSGWLVELGSAEHALAFYGYLVGLRRQNRLPSAIELVPGAQTVLLDGPPPRLSRADLNELIISWHESPPAADAAVATTVSIPVRYDGEDLDDLAALTGLTVAQLIEAHRSSDLTVAFCGFVPGFAYLTGLPPILHVPRRPMPRAAVPAGAVALAAGYTGIYPRSSPGGWHILGHTGIQLWDERSDTPALLTAGTRVRFVAEQP